MRLRKFFEEAGKELDIEYITQCFVDFFDSGEARMESKNSAAYGNWVEIRINTEKIKALKEYNDEFDYQRSRKAMANWVTNTNNISKYADGLIYISEFIKKVESCLKRLSDEYPDYSYKIWTNGLLRQYGDSEVSEVIIFIWP